MTLEEVEAIPGMIEEILKKERYKEGTKYKKSMVKPRAEEKLDTRSDDKVFKINDIF